MDNTATQKVAFNYEGIAEAWRQSEGWKASGDVLPARDLAFPAGITLADGTPVIGVRLMPYPADRAAIHGAGDSKPCAIHLLEPGTRKATGKLLALLPEGKLHAEAAYSDLLRRMQTEAPQDFTGTVGEVLPTEGWYAAYSLVDAPGNDVAGNEASDFAEFVQMEYIHSGAAAANEIFTVYLKLSPQEQDRVYHFTMDAMYRDENQALFDFKPVELLVMFLEEVAQGKGKETICQELVLLPYEFDLLRWNWETLQRVEAAIQKRVQERYGK